MTARASETPFKTRSIENKWEMLALKPTVIKLWSFISRNEHMEISRKLHVTGKSTRHRGYFSNICPTSTKLNSSTLTNGNMLMWSRSKHGLISAGALQLSGTLLTFPDRSEKHVSSQERWGINNSE